MQTKDERLLPISKQIVKKLKEYILKNYDPTMINITFTLTESLCLSRM